MCFYFEVTWSYKATQEEVAARVAVKEAAKGITVTAAHREQPLLEHCMELLPGENKSVRSI